MAEEAKDKAAAPHKDPPLLHQFVAGTMSGFGCIAVGHPFDTIKTRLQIDGNSANGVRKYTGALDCLKKTVSNEGILALYKGVKSPLMGNPPIYCISFGTWGIAEKVLTSWGYTQPKEGGGVQMTVPGMFMTGAFSGFCQAIVFAPQERVKKLLMAQDQAKDQASKARYKGMFDCARQVMKEEGVSGLYRGYPMVVCAYMPAMALWYGSYAFYRRTLNKDERNPSTWKTLLAGGGAGVTAWGVMFPFDTIGARIQTQDAKAYKGIGHVIGTLYKAEGIAGFYKGFVPCIMRAFPADGALFIVYELSLQVLRAVDPQ